ncbi:STAS domain-containing protein [Actinomycetospora endophytica]|uniref:STAS domain-containing protein n=1 Tax=Actinomycetospora endophytica TaxID=2291215 RepID=A0ABS8PC55_9PSEU|nr:STAS domain-containing protein [Actinomycetospora endophytica]MCD2195869.1 STAS domain-containing protein [Actinomycetospora endophytica]
MPPILEYATVAHCEWTSAKVLAAMYHPTNTAMSAPAAGFGELLSISVPSIPHGAGSQAHPPGSPSGRAAALAAVTVEACAAGSRRPVAAESAFGEGCVALALGGRFNRAAVDELESLLRDLRPSAGVELVIDLTALAESHPRLGRVLGRIRIRCLVDGAAMALHHLPPALADELDLPMTGPAYPTSALHPAGRSGSPAPTRPAMKRVREEPVLPGPPPSTN